MDSSQTSASGNVPGPHATLRSATSLPPALATADHHPPSPAGPAARHRLRAPLGKASCAAIAHQVASANPSAQSRAHAGLLRHRAGFEQVVAESLQRPGRLPVGLVLGKRHHSIGRSPAHPPRSSEARGPERLPRTAKPRRCGAADGGCERPLHMHWASVLRPRSRSGSVTTSPSRGGIGGRDEGEHGRVPGPPPIQRPPHGRPVR
jgi:hypothetical protein